MSLLTDQETKIGLSLGWVFSRYYRCAYPKTQWIFGSICPGLSL